MNCVTLFCYWGGATCDGPDGVTYNKPPNKAIKAYPGMQFDDLVERIYRATSIDKQKHHIKVICRYPSVGVGKTIKYVLLPIKDNDDVDIMFDVVTLHQEVSTLDLYLEVEDNAPIRNAETASRNLESFVIKEETSNELLPTNTSNAVPPLNDLLKKKQKTPPSPLPVAEKSNFVGKSRSNVNLESDVNAPKVNPKSGLTDSDWTELLSAPSKTVNGSNGGVPRVPGLLKDGKRQVRSGSNLERKRNQDVVNSSARRSDAAFRDKAIGDILDVNQPRNSSDSKHATVGVQVKNVQNRPSLSGVPITSSPKKTESLSANDGVVSLDTDSDSTSDCEGEREREQRRKRREKQSFKKIIDERAKRQAQEHPRDSSNASASENLASMIAPDGSHTFIHFGNERDVEKRNAWNTKLASIRLQNIESGKTVDWNALETLGQDALIRSFLHREYKNQRGKLIFTCRAWEELMSIEEPIYRELCLEFCSTYTHDRTITDPDVEGALKFRLGGISRSLTLFEFAERVGLYPRELINSVGLKVALKRYITSAAREIPDDFDYNDFWNEIGRGRFSAGISKASDIIRPDYRLLHRMITCSITARKDGQDKVTQKDLWFLRQIIDPTRRTNVPFCLADALSVATGLRTRSPIVFGQFITRLAHSLHVFNSLVVSSMTECPAMGKIDMSMMRRMRVAHYTRNRQSTVWGDDRDPQVQQPEEHQEEEILEMPDQPWDPRTAYDDLVARMSNMEVAHTSLRDLMVDHYRRLTYQQSRLQYTMDWQQRALSQFFRTQHPTFQLEPYQPPPQWGQQDPNPPNYSSWDEWFGGGGQ